MIGNELLTSRRRATALARADELKAFVEARAACRGLDVNVFFPDPEDAAGIAAAKGVCGRCLARAECLEWAQTTREPYGVWGGLTEVERARLRRRTARDRRVGGRATGPALCPVPTPADREISPRQRRRLAERRAS